MAGNRRTLAVYKPKQQPHPAAAYMWKDAWSSGHLVATGDPDLDWKMGAAWTSGRADALFRCKNDAYSSGAFDHRISSAYCTGWMAGYAELKGVEEEEFFMDVEIARERGFSDGKSGEPVKLSSDDIKEPLIREAYLEGYDEGCDEKNKK